MRPPHRRFEGKSVLVTGASSGIGEAAARAFAREGARVALVARRTDALARVAGEISREGGEAAAFPCDVGAVGAPNALGALVDRVIARFGAVDVLVNGAGVNHRGPIDRWSTEALGQIIAVNLEAPIILARLLVPHMKARGAGAIVSVASLAGRVPLRDEAVYSASKFALRTFTFALGEELRGSGVTVSVVSPGPVDSAFIRSEIDAIPDVVFAQPMLSVERVAAMVIDCAWDGRAERAAPRTSAFLATVGYLFPRLRRGLSGLMSARGARAKRAYAARLARTDQSSTT
jgi:short-subunit dehydrogenase